MESKKYLAALGLCALVMGGPPARAESFTTLDVIQRSASADCLDWCITGLCFWLKCGLTGCHVTTTPRIEHNLPDLVVTSYPHAGESPWLEARASYGPAAKAAVRALQGADGAGRAANNLHRNEGRGQPATLKFKETQVIGSPAAAAVSGAPFMCQSQTTPGMAYYLSELDALAWRAPEAELWRPETLIPGRREISQAPPQTWGSVFPRSGYVMSAEDPKAAAVTAQRAIDIVSQPGQAPHVYRPLGWRGAREVQTGDPKAKDEDSCIRAGGAWLETRAGRGRCRSERSVMWLPPAAEQSDRWQMISPAPQNYCEAFGSPAEWSAGKYDPEGRYAFNYWRHYKCCMPGPGRFLFATDIPPACL